MSQNKIRKGWMGDPCLTQGRLLWHLPPHISRLKSSIFRETPLWLQAALRHRLWMGGNEMVVTIEDRLSWALSRIHELEEELEETRDIVRRLTEGNPVEWEV